MAIILIVALAFQLVAEDDVCCTRRTVVNCSDVCAHRAAVEMRAPAQPMSKEPCVAEFSF